MIAVQLASTLYMTGLIWFVQLVHYPLFAVVGDKQRYHVEHQRRTTWVVFPPMLAEFISAGYLLWTRFLWVDAAGALLLGVIWLSTAFLQVPCHYKLTEGFDLGVVRRLVVSNWLRTIAWSLRSLLLLATL